jgi:hypothetical protein
MPLPAFTLLVSRSSSMGLDHHLWVWKDLSSDNAPFPKISSMAVFGWEKQSTVINQILLLPMLHDQWRGCAAGTCLDRRQRRRLVDFNTVLCLLITYTWQPVLCNEGQEYNAWCVEATLCRHGPHSKESSCVFSETVLAKTSSRNQDLDARTRHTSREIYSA